MAYTYKFCPNCGLFLHPNKDGLMECGKDGCGFVHWDNPTPAVAVVVPINDGVLLVQRGIEPHKGKWCLPCGFLNPKEDPATAAIREVKEETGVDLWHVSLLKCQCPVPGVTNQIVITYLGSPSTTSIKAGDDAIDAKVWKPEEITAADIAFPLHVDLLRTVYGISLH